MKLNDALLRAKQTTEGAKQRERQKMEERTLTPQGIIRYFYDQHELYDWDTPLPQKKEVQKWINGFLRMLRNNGMEDREIRQFIATAVKNWPTKKARTNNGKPYILADKPNLQDIIVCSQWLLNELEVQPKKDEGKSLLEMWRRD